MRKEPAYGQITPEQQRRMDVDAAELQRRREAAAFRSVLEDRRPVEPEVNCAGCDHLGDFDDEGRRGFCMFLRLSRSTWHPVFCQTFVPLKRQRTIKVAWKGVVYG